MAKMLITGGSGFIGRNLVEYLGQQNTVMAPSSKELNLLDEEAVRHYLCVQHFDVVIHAATTRSHRRNPGPPDLLDRNCRMFFNLARNEGLLGKLICFGSGAEYGCPGLPPHVTEEYFDTHVPSDAYGFSKYICAKYAERCQRIIELRLFGVFGKYEAWDVRIISNLCCRLIHGLPLTIRQDAVFDYLYIEDLVKITAWFAEHDPRHKAYNVCSGYGYHLTELAQIIITVSGQRVPVAVQKSGLGREYSGSNDRLLAELSGYKLRGMQDAIAELYAWYEAHRDEVDPRQLRFDG